MKKWLTTQQMANDIAEMDKSCENKELNIAECNSIASKIAKMYCEGGKEWVVTGLRKSVGSLHIIGRKGYSYDQLDRIDKIVKDMFKWHWLPFSKIRRNMKRITK